MVAKSTEDIANVCEEIRRLSEEHGAVDVFRAVVDYMARLQESQEHAEICFLFLSYYLGDLPRPRFYFQGVGTDLSDALVIYDFCMRRPGMPAQLAQVQNMFSESIEEILNAPIKTKQ